VLALLTSDLLGALTWPVIDRFRFGDTFAISPHGIFIAIGFGIGAWIFTKLAIQRGVPEDLANSVVFWSLIGAIVGARVGYVIAHYADFDTPLEWFEVWKGGISLLGGIAGATIANAVSIKRKSYRLRFFQVADAVVPGLAFGIAIGRIGDLIIADHLGKPTSWLLAWTYRGGTVAPPFSCQGEVCQAQLQGGHLQILERGGSRLLDEIAQFMCARLQVVKVEHALRDPPKKSRHAVLAHFATRGEQRAPGCDPRSERNEIVLVAAGSMQQQQRRPRRSRSGLEAVNEA